MPDEPGEDASPVTGPAWSYQPPGQREDIVMIGARARTDKSRRIAIGAAVAAVAMLGGAAVAFAASSATASPSGAAAHVAGTSPSPSPTFAPKRCPDSARPCRPFRRPFRQFGFPPGLPFGLGFAGGALGAVHGQVVLAKPGGGYETVDIQRGKVTTISESSITVRSADGFTATYAVTASTVVDAQRDGLGSVKAGNQVSVLATVSGSTETATSITDITLLGPGHPS